MSIIEGAILGGGLVFCYYVLKMMREGLDLKRLQLKKEGKI